MNAFNSENENSPLIKAGSNVFKINNERNIADGLKSKRKQFPELRYGNNPESPNFLKISKVDDNPLIKSKSSRIENNYGNSQYNLINRSVDNFNKNINHNFNRPEIVNNSNGNITKEMEKYMNKFTNRMKNVINISADNNNRSILNPTKNSISDNNLTSENSLLLPQKENFGKGLLNNSNNNNRYIKSPLYSLQHDHKQFDSSTYLMNINDYNIKESYKVNEDRLLKYNKKNIEDYNCIVGKKVSLTPPKYSVDKWPLFYEKYML